MKTELIEAAKIMFLKSAQTELKSLFPDILSCFILILIFKGKT